MSDTWDKLAVSKPVDRQTALSNSGGLGHTWSKLPTSRDQKHWEDAPQTLREPLPGSLDLRGRRFGRFTVVGLLDRAATGFTGKPTQKAKWLVKCACGRFEHRLAKAIQSPANYGDRCAHCERTARERRKAWCAQTGRNDGDWRDF